MLTVFSRVRRAVLAMAIVAGAAALPAETRAAEKVNLDNAFFAIKLPGFFGGAKNGARLKIYAVRREGKWVAAVANSNSDTGRPAYNTAFYPVELGKVSVADGRVVGEARVILVPDPWVPPDQKPKTVTVTFDGTIGPGKDTSELASIAGKWSSKLEGEVPAAGAKGGNVPPNAEGNLLGGIGATGPNDVKNQSYDFAVYGLIPGKAPEEFHRRRALSIGIKDGKAVSARLGQMDMRHNALDYQTIEAPASFQVDSDSFSGSMSFKADTIDGEQASFTITIEGARVAGFLVGTYKGTYAMEDGREIPIAGFIRGNARPGAFVPAAEAEDNRPWFVPTAGWKAVQPGEHPRLFFRKDDVAEMRRRADTPEGRKIIARLRELLDGANGEGLPKNYNPADKAYAGGFRNGPGGNWTVSHAAGYGFLYQLTGDKKYCDLARECIEKSWAGQRNSDDRYAWVAPGGELRAGPTLAMHAIAYDFCYDGWDEAFRQKVAKSLQDYTDTRGGEWNHAEGITLHKMVMTPKQGPGSNHYGAVVGGCGITVLAIKGDPGTDETRLAKYQETLERAAIRHFMDGWGDGGYYKEGWGASRVGTQGGAFLMYMQALRTAAGKDMFNGEREAASYITMVPRALMVVGSPAVMPYRSAMGPTYGNANVGGADQNHGWSTGGIYAEGFGAVAEKYKPALLWIYNHQFDPRNAFNFDTANVYPIRPVMALINWPTFAGVKEANPATVLPLAIRDHHYNYFTFRNKFEGTDDIVTTVLINVPGPTKPRDVMVWGFGKAQISFGEPKNGSAVTHAALGKDGSGSIATAGWALGVDYSKASGAEALFITTGAPKPAAGDPRVKVQTVTVGTDKFTVMTLSTGAHPTVSASGNTVTAGAQVIEFKNGKFVFGTFTPQ